MKAFFAALALVLVSLTSHAYGNPASFPSFQGIIKYEKNFVAKSAEVKSYVQQLGGSEYSVSRGGKLRVYKVTTNNGCIFAVRVVYKNWPGIDQLVISQAICQ